MTRTQAFPLVMFASALALASSTPGRLAHAQTAGTGGTSTVTSGTFGVQLMRVGSDKYQDSTTYMTPIGKKACDLKLPLYFRLSGFPNNYTKMEAWTGSSCADADRNTRVTTESRCEFLTSEDLSPGNQTIYDDYAVPTEKICDDPDGDRQIWFLALNTSGTEVVAATAYAALTLRFDFSPPSQITNFAVGNGYTQLEASWAEPAGDPYYYYLLIDTRGGQGDGEDGGVACNSSFLKPGTTDVDPTANVPDGILKVYIDEKSKRDTLNGMNWGVDEAAVGIIPLDRALNYGPMSNVVCPKVVPTKGFWETYQENNGTVEPGCTCSTPGRPHPGSAGGYALSVFALGILLRRVRRRR